MGSSQCQWSDLEKYGWIWRPKHNKTQHSVSRAYNLLWQVGHFQLFLGIFVLHCFHSSVSRAEFIPETHQLVVGILHNQHINFCCSITESMGCLESRSGVHLSFLQGHFFPRISQLALVSYQQLTCRAIVRELVVIHTFSPENGPWCSFGIQYGKRICIWFHWLGKLAQIR